LRWAWLAVTTEVDRFLRARIGISILVRHYLELKKSG
jgi:hypothetical protein